MLASLAVRCAPNYRLCWLDGRGRSIDDLHLACIVREATAALGQRQKRLEFKPREATMKKLLIATAIVGVPAVLSLMTIYSSVPTNAQSARCPCFTELMVVGSGKSASESECVFTKISTKQLGHVGVLQFCSPQNRQLMFTITPQDCKGFAGNLPAELFRNVDETIDMSDLEGGRGALMAAAETLDCREMPE